jgi:hypothetical protein
MEDQQAKPPVLPWLNLVTLAVVGGSLLLYIPALTSSRPAVELRADASSFDDEALQPLPLRACSRRRAASRRSASPRRPCPTTSVGSTSPSWFEAPCGTLSPQLRLRSRGLPIHS